MRADKWSFKALSLLLAACPTIILWFLLKNTLHPIWFLVPLYWIYHVRDMKSRLRELNDRIALNCDMIVMQSPLENAYELYDSLYVEHGFTDEADKLDRLDRL